MQTAKAVHDRATGVLVLAPDCDATQLRLSAAEGYLLSRIDGTTSWRLLREIGGLPPSDVDACLTRWIEQGLVQVREGASRRGPPATAGEAATEGAAAVGAGGSTPRDPDPPAIDESALDGDLEIDIAIQRRILEFEACLDRPYHELLGVDPGADARDVKRAYFKLSKEFHPDRFFRREIGSYEDRLERIFKKILEAHEILSDPDLRQVENHPAVETGARDSERSAAAAGAAGADRTPPAPRQPTKLERLRQRMPFKIDHASMAARRAKASEIFKAAEASQRAGRLQEADASLRIAISFDPTRSELKEALGSVRVQMAGARAAKLLETPCDRMSDGILLEALDLIEDVLIYRPHDPELNERAARICIRLGKLEAAREYAETCVDRCPEVAAHQVLLGRIHRENGDYEAARSAFEAALECDAGDMEARRALAAMRIGHRNAVRGGEG